MSQHTAGRTGARSPVTSTRTLGVSEIHWLWAHEGFSLAVAQDVSFSSVVHAVSTGDFKSFFELSTSSE